MRKSALWLVALVVINILGIRPHFVHAAGTITYKEPIAYIGWDGNIWITDLQSGVGTQITKDGNVYSPWGGGVDFPEADTGSTDSRPYYYSNIQWSPTD